MSTDNEPAIDIPPIRRCLLEVMLGDRSIPRRMVPVVQPEPGDVIIECSRKAQAASFAVYASPGPPQIVFGDYEQALVQACRFAVRVRVDVWVREEGDGDALVARYRLDGRRG